MYGLPAGSCDHVLVVSRKMVELLGDGFSCDILLTTGFAMMVQVASTNTLIQSMVPDRYRGRVMSVYSMMLIGTSPIGAMTAGFKAEHIGARLTITIGAAICLVSSIVFAVRLPAFRKAARELITE